MNEQKFHYKGQETQGPLERDYWKLLSLMMQDHLLKDTDAIILVRFEQLQHFAKDIWKEAAVSLASIVAAESENLLARDDLILGFDDISYIVIAGEKNHESSSDIAQRLADAIGLHLMGSPLGRSSIELWQVRGITDKGISSTQITVSQTAVPSLPEDKEQGIQSDLKLIGTAKFNFLPIWHVRRNVVMAFECVPRWQLDSGDILDEIDLSERFQKHDMVYALDAETVQHAVDQVINVIEHDALASIVVPIHYDTICNDLGFELFLRAYGGLMPVWRERVSFEIKSIPVDTDFEKLKATIQRIWPYCYGLYVQVPFDFQGIGDFGVEGLLSIGLDLNHDDREEAVIISDLENFITKAAEYNTLHTHAFGLKTVSLSVAAICAGFDYIGSRPIEKELDGWGLDDFLIKPIDLYKQLLKSR